MRETTKQLTLSVGGEEYTFQIRKMNALAGTGLVKFCAEKLLPVYKQLQSVFQSEDIDVSDMDEAALKAKEEEIAEARTDRLLQMIPEALASLTDDELISFETRCLQTVDILKKAGWQQVMTGKHFSCEEIEYDPATVLRLVYEVLVFNLGSFFGENSFLSFPNSQNSSRPKQ